jgi:4-amino-4-deoxy-L-arabinose transferase-like glycosyltransferase
MRNLLKNNFLLIIILLLAFGLRIYGITWDNVYHQHPDERFVTMVTLDIAFPESLIDFYDTENTMSSAYNTELSGLTYGNLPILITKYIASIVDMHNYDQVQNVGRFVNAVFDTCLVLLIYIFVKTRFNKSSALLASFFYAMSIIAIQNSHYYTVDIIQSFWVFVTFYILSKLLNIAFDKKNITKFTVFAAISFGFAIASKISAIVFLPIAILIIMSGFLKNKTKNWGMFLVYFSQIYIFILIAFLSFRAVNPHIFLNNSWLEFSIRPEFINSITFVIDTTNGSRLWPPAYQWFHSTRYLSPLFNLSFFGVGIGVAILYFCGIINIFINKVKLIYNNRKNFQHIIRNLISLELIIVIWTIFLFLYSGGQFVKFMRYFLPIIPFVTIIAALAITNVFSKYKKYYYAMVVLSIIITSIGTLLFMRIYTEDHTRIQASRWIFDNVAENSNIAHEYWDDALPLGLTQKDYPHERLTHYNISGINVFDEDNDQKIQLLYSQIENIDYIVLSSTRGSHTIGKLPDIYPYMTNYYRALDEGTLGFELVYEVKSKPFFVDIIDRFGWLEEAFHVYDHPPVKIYKRTNNIDYLEFEKILSNETTNN